MGQKIHPLGFRIGITQQHRSTWFAKPRLYALLVQEDRVLRNYLTTRLADAAVSRVQLTRKSDRLEVEIHTACPGAVVGHNGQTLESLRAALKARVRYARRVAIHVVELANPGAEAPLIAEFIGQKIEERMPFRRAVREGVQRAMRSKGVEGVKVEVAGRLNGAEIARSEWVREGRVPLHTIRADVDYCDTTANTIYGVIGIKVWIFRGEILPNQSTGG